MASYEQLFLLEVLINKVHLLEQVLAGEDAVDQEEEPIRVRVKFSEFPCFEISQDMSCPEAAYNTHTRLQFRSGKSCMFAMDPQQLLTDLADYPMAVTVFRKNTQLPMPDVIGQAKVFLGEQTTEIVQRAAEWTLEEPLSQRVQGTFELENSQDQCVGTIDMLTRLTCFGKTIITKFQIADKTKSFLFGHAQNTDYEFQCRKCKPGQPIFRPQDACTDYQLISGACTDYQHIPDAPGNLQTEADQEANIETQEPQEEDGQVGEETVKEMIRCGPTPAYKQYHVRGDGFSATMEVQGDHQQVQEEELEPEAPCPGKETLRRRRKRRPRRRRRKPRKPRRLTEHAYTADECSPALEKKKKPKKRSKFYLDPNLSYPGVVLGHKWCIGRGAPVPAEHGWAWKTTMPYGMKWEDMKGWTPGAYLKRSWRAMKQVKKERAMQGTRVRRRKLTQPDARKPTVHVHRKKGVYHVTVNPLQVPGQPEQEPLVYTLDRPEESSASELELDLTVPDAPPPPRPKVKHQAQQFCEEDLPLPKPIGEAKKKKKKRDDSKPTSAIKKRSTTKSEAGLSGSKNKTRNKSGSTTSRSKGRSESVDSKKGKSKSKAKKTPNEERNETPVQKRKEKTNKSPVRGQSKEKSRSEATKEKGDKTQTKEKIKKRPESAKTVSSKESKSIIEKGGKGKNAGADEKGRKRYTGAKVYPWDGWIMDLKCRAHSKSGRSSHSILKK